METASLAKAACSTCDVLPFFVPTRSDWTDFRDEVACGLGLLRIQPMIQQV